MNLIFDFDGTLADTFDHAIDIFNLLSDKFHYRKIEALEVPILRDMSSTEFVKHLQIPLYKIPAVIIEARMLMRKRIQELAPIKNIQEVLHALHAKGFKLGILTTNSLENVTLWLKEHGLLELFHFIHNESSFFGKNGKLKKLLKGYKISQAEAFYIGDETRDIEAAKHCKIASIAVAWGFNSEKILSQSQPDYLLHTPEDLLKIFSV